MTVEVIGIDHGYVTVRDMEGSERFYERVMGAFWTNMLADFMVRPIRKEP